MSFFPCLVAPREWFQCVDPINPTIEERWPENIYHEFQIDVPRRGEKKWLEPLNVMYFKWLFGEDFAFLLDPQLYIDRFTYIQSNPAGTLPIKIALPTVSKGQVADAAPGTPAQVVVQPSNSAQPETLQQ